MRWRLLDVLDRLEPWRLAEGRKAVSLEEYRLAEPLGRDRELPGALVLACCVELARWLVLRSSGLRQTCALAEVTDFALRGTAGPGDVLRVGVSARRGDGETLCLACRADVGEREIAAGAIAVSLLPAADREEPGRLATAWRELRGQA